MIPVKAKTLKSQIGGIAGNNSQSHDVWTEVINIRKDTEKKQKAVEEVNAFSQSIIKENEDLLKIFQDNLGGLPMHPWIGIFSFAIGVATFIVGVNYEMRVPSVVINMVFAGVVSSLALTTLCLKMDGKPMPGADDITYILAASTVHNLMLPIIWKANLAEPITTLYLNGCTTLVAHYGLTTVDPLTLSNFVFGASLTLSVSFWLAMQPDFGYLQKQPIEHML